MPEEILIQPILPEVLAVDTTDNTILSGEISDNHLIDLDAGEVPVEELDVTLVLPKTLEVESVSGIPGEETVTLSLHVGLGFEEPEVAQPTVPVNVLNILNSMVVGDISELIQALNSLTPVPGPAGELVHLTQVQLNALQAAGELDKKVVYFITNRGRMAIANNSSSYKEFIGIHIGDDPPEDTSLIWFDTNAID